MGWTGVCYWFKSAHRTSVCHVCRKIIVGRRRSFSVNSHCFSQFRVHRLPSKEAITTKEATSMALYMVQGAYTSEAIATMAKNPQDRSVPVRELLQKLRGRLVGFYFCFGEYAVVALGELPDDSAATAVALAAISAGYLKPTRRPSYSPSRRQWRRCARLGASHSRDHPKGRPGVRWPPAAGLLPRAFPIVSLRATR